VRDIGMDIHRDFCEVAISEAGEIRSAPRIATTPEGLELFALWMVFPPIGFDSAHPRPSAAAGAWAGRLLQS
jgi:hypothetical protein